MNKQAYLIIFVSLLVSGCTDMSDFSFSSPVYRCGEPINISYFNADNSLLTIYSESSYPDSVWSRNVSGNGFISLEAYSIPPGKYVVEFSSDGTVIAIDEIFVVRCVRYANDLY